MSRPLCALLVIATLVFSAVGVAATAAAAGPKLVFDTTEIVFRNVKEGSKQVAQFTFTNQGDLNLIIDKVSPSCGCTVAKFQKITPPGDKGTITLELDTEGITGAFRKTAVVATNDSSQPFATLVMVGETKSRVEIVGETSRRIQVIGCLGEKISTTVTLADPEGKRLMIAAVENPMKAYMDAKLKALPGGKKYELTLTAKAKEAMEFAGPVFLVVPGSSKVSLFAVVEVRGPFTAQPHDLFFGALVKGLKPMSRSVLVKRACSPQLKIAKLDYNRDLFEIKQDWTKPGERLMLEIIPKVDKLPKGSFNETLGIQASDKLFKIRLKGVVR
jgi:hypothetical protein